MINLNETKETVTFNCMFEARGRDAQYTHHAFFNVTNDYKTTRTLYIGDNVIKNATDIDIQRYSIKPLMGKLQDDKTFINAKLVFIKKNYKTGKFTDVIKDICYVDKGGNYQAFITNGTYDIEIYINNQKLIKRNIEVKNGLKSTYYIEIDDAILNKNKDIISYCNCDYKTVSGCLVDNNNNPLANAELLLIDTNNKLQTYVITNKDGNYRFAIKNGEYTLKIRSDVASMKQTNIVIDDTHTFYEQIARNNVLFNKEVMLRL